MPVSDFGDWPKVHTVRPGFRILATMVYPIDLTRDDPVARSAVARHQEFHTTLMVTWAEKPLNSPCDTDIWKVPPSISEVSALLSARNRGGHWRTFIDRLKKRHIRGL